MVWLLEGLISIFKHRFFQFFHSKIFKMLILSLQLSSFNIPRGIPQFHARWHTNAKAFNIQYSAKPHLIKRRSCPFFCNYAQKNGLLPPWVYYVSLVLFFHFTQTGLIRFSQKTSDWAMTNEFGPIAWCWHKFDSMRNPSTLLPQVWPLGHSHWYHLKAG